VMSSLQLSVSLKWQLKMESLCLIVMNTNIKFIFT
jgi:hypothetical protein